MAYGHVDGRVGKCLLCFAALSFWQPGANKAAEGCSLICSTSRSPAYDYAQPKREWRTDDFTGTYFAQNTYVSSNISNKSFKYGTLSSILTYNYLSTLIIWLATFIV